MGEGKSSLQKKVMGLVSSERGTDEPPGFGCGHTPRMWYTSLLERQSVKRLTFSLIFKSQTLYKSK